MLFLAGLGGAGCKVVELFYRKGVVGSLLSKVSAPGEALIAGVAVDTSDSLESLTSIPVGKRVLIGRSRAKGHGTGGDLALGRKILTEEYELAMNVLSEAGFRKAEVIFLVAGLGGGTGTGGFPVLAEKIRAVYRTPVVGVLFLPARSEGVLYSKNALEGFAEVVKSVDGVVILDNNALTSMGMVITKAYMAVDEAIFLFLGNAQPSNVLKTVKGKMSTIASMELKAERVALKDLVKALLKNHLYFQVGEAFEALHLLIYGDKRRIYGQEYAEDWIKKKFGAKLTLEYKEPLNLKVIRCTGIITGVRGFEERLAVDVQEKEVSSELQNLLEDIHPL